MSISIKDMMALMSSKDDKQIHAFETRIEDSIKDINKAAIEDSAIKDAYGNSLLSIGNQDESAKFSNYSFTNDTLNWPLWLALYNESWVFRRTIDKPAQDEIKCGITLNKCAKASEVQRRLKLYRDDLIQLLSWGALFGGSIAVALFDNVKGKEYEERLSKKKLKEAKTLKFYVTDRWYGVAPDYEHVVTNMKNPDYGKPKYYNVTMADGKTYRYHHDYIIRYEHRFAPKFVKNGMLQGWGYSEGSHILNELARDEKLKTSIQSLVDKSLIEVIKMAGMRGIFLGTDQENEQQLQKRLEMVNWGRSFNSLTFLDKDDEYEMNNFSGLGGLADLLQQNMWQIAAAVEMQGVLFGDMKQGFSTDSDALERYAETIMERCESYVRPVYEKLLKYIYLMLGLKDTVDFEFNSLLDKKHKQDKVVATTAFASLCSQLLGDGVIDTVQYAKALQQYVDDDSINFNIDNDAIEKLKQNQVLEAENFDIDLDNDNAFEHDDNEDENKEANK